MTEFRVMDSKVWASGRTHTPPVWIDSYRVVFLTGSKFKANEHNRSLAIWDSRGGARIHRENVNDFCFRSGTIVYKVSDKLDESGTRGTWFAGKLGDEKPMRDDRQDDVARLRDRINCLVVPDRGAVERERSANRTVVRLIEGHGELDLGALRGNDVATNTPIAFVRPRITATTSLPFGRYDVHTPPTFYPYQSAYLFQDLFYGKRERTASPKSSEKSERRLAWSLGIDGMVLEHLVFDGPWTSGPVPTPFLTRKGIGFVNHGGIYDRTDGIYLISAGKATRLIGGRVSIVGVSETGCQLAFSHAPDMKADLAKGQVLRTLKAVDLCIGRK